jgi:hypothetical protein
LHFGENFYPRLFASYRNKYEEYALIKEEEEMQQIFIIETSNIANYNLIPFFQK